MGSFEKCLAVTEVWEGGWSDHAADPGGKTKYGITQATLSAYLGRPASAAEIRDLSRETARAIYRRGYWDRIGGDRLPAGIDLCVFDFGVNSGPDRAVRSLQAALGVVADGWVGDKTLRALLGVDHAKLIATLCDRRIAFMKVAKDKKGKLLWPHFKNGWTNRVNDIRARALRMAAGVTAGAPAFIASPLESAKALDVPAETSVSTDQKAGILGAFGLMGTVATFWRENADLLADPKFLVAMAVSGAVVGYLLLRKPKTVEQLA